MQRAPNVPVTIEDLDRRLRVIERLLGIDVVNEEAEPLPIAPPSVPTAAATGMAMGGGAAPTGPLNRRTTTTPSPGTLPPPPLME